MPPISPGTQGSRAAMVGWLVAMSIIAVLTTVLAIYFYVDADSANKRLVTITQRYEDILAPADFNREEIEALKAARSDETQGLNPSMKLLDVALAQRDRLAKLISGSEDSAAAVAAAANVVAQARQAGAKPAGDSLKDTIEALVVEVNARKTEAENNRAALEEARAQLKQNTEATQAQIAALQKNVEQIRAEKDAALQELQRITQTQSQSFQTAAADLRKQLEAAQEQINALNARNSDLSAQAKKLQTELDRVLERLNEIRVDPSKAVTRQPDGRIVRLPGNDVAFIDLGLGDQITPGLTFEVFDKVEGIPPPGDPTTEENLPQGKASLEVIRVGPTSSECRITRRAPGAALSEGDLIVNLVYDRNTKYNFLVHGNFDLDQNGVATSQDAEVIKRLITQWGGNIVGEINVDTDFVVLGKEPVVPDRPTEPDPIAQANYERAVAEYDAYQDISAKARTYRIPILNQNRFLYLVGYYEQAKR